MANPAAEPTTESDSCSNDLCSDRLVIVLENVESSTMNSKVVTLGAANLVPRTTDLDSPSKRRSTKTDRRSSKKRGQSTSTEDELGKTKKRSKWLPSMGNPETESHTIASVEAQPTVDHLDTSSLHSANLQVLPTAKVGNNEMTRSAPSITAKDQSFTPLKPLDLDVIPDPIKEVISTSSPKLLDRSMNTDPESELEGSSWQPSDDQEPDDDDDLEWSEACARRRSLSGRQRTSSRQSSDCRSNRKNKQSTRVGDSSSSHRTSLNGDIDAGTAQNPIQLDDSRYAASDDYCWICHKVGEMVICSYCPRVYHPACLYMDKFPDTWLCPECQDLLVSECVWYQQPNWRKVTPKRLQRMLCFLINRLSMQQWAEHFREPVDTKKVVGYSDLIAYPMDLRTLYERNKNGQYASAQAFLSDFRWILHNCTIFNGRPTVRRNMPSSRRPIPSSLLTSHARILDRVCQRELALMKACPVCYENRMIAMSMLPSTSTTLPLLSKKEWLPSFGDEASKSTSTVCDDGSVAQTTTPADTTNSENLDPWWFTKLCDQIHPLVWVRLLNYPVWPGKVMTVDGNNLLVSFFGDYDVITAPTGSAQLHSLARAGRSSQYSSDTAPAPTLEPIDSPLSIDSSRTPPPPALSSVNTTTSRSSKTTDHSTDPNYKRAVAELDYHVSLIQARFPKFKLPPVSLEFNRGNVNRFYKCFSEALEVDLSPSKRKAITVVDTEVNTQPKIIPATSPLRDQANQSTQNPKSSVVGFYSEPLLTRMADSLRGSLKTTPSRGTRMSTNAVVESVHLPVPSVENSNSHPLNNSVTIADSATVTAPDASMDTIEDGLPGPSEPVRHTAPSVLQPLPTESAPDPTDGDEVHLLFDKFRSQINETLKSLEEKWRMTRSSVATAEYRSTMSNEPPILSPVTTEKQIQTLQAEPVDRIETKPSTGSIDEQEEHQDRGPPGLTAFQAVMMESEIHRLDRENQRLNLLLAFTRAEMALEMRNRITELRRVWNFEISAILEAASKIWEQDVIRIVDAVKRKQWCAYCGRLAYYYCCWNTCYCNSGCQSKHWASHINVCVQARSKNKVPPTPTSSRELGDLQQLQRQQQQQQQNSLASMPLTSGQSLLPSNQTRWPKGVGQ